MTLFGSEIYRIAKNVSKIGSLTVLATAAPAAQPVSQTRMGSTPGGVIFQMGIMALYLKIVEKPIENQRFHKQKEQYFIRFSIGFGFKNSGKTNVFEQSGQRKKRRKTNEKSMILQ